MWSDTLFLAERGHLLRLALWSAASITAGTSILAFLTVRRLRSPLLSGFAIQMQLWGIVLLATFGIGLHSLVARDLSAATRLDRFVWLSTGFDAGLVVVGMTLAVSAWRMGRRLGVVGAGIGIAVQGMALFALYAGFARILNGLI